MTTVLVEASAAAARILNITGTNDSRQHCGCDMIGARDWGSGAMPMAEATSRKAEPETVALEAAVDQAIAACDGDVRAAMRALVVSIDFHEAELQALREEVATLTAAVSRGYARSRSYVSSTMTGKGTSEPPASV